MGLCRYQAARRRCGRPGRTLTLLLDGSEGLVSPDNIDIDRKGTLLIQEGDLWTGTCGDWPGDKRLVGIDYRVQDGVGNADGVYSIDGRGQANKVKQLTVALNGTNFDVDFNRRRTRCGSSATPARTGKVHRVGTFGVNVSDLAIPLAQR